MNHTLGMCCTCDNNEKLLVVNGIGGCQSPIATEVSCKKMYRWKCSFCQYANMVLIYCFTLLIYCRRKSSRSLHQITPNRESAH